MDSFRLSMLLVTGFLALPGFIRAQSGFRPLTDLQIFGSSTFEYRETVTDIKDIKGSPYLDEEFREGKVLMNQIMYEGVRLRYNVYNDLFEANLGEQTIVIDPARNNIDTLYYDEIKFVRKFLNPEKNQELSNVAVIYKHERCILYKKFRINLIPASKASAYVEAKPAEFDPETPDYYLGRGGDMILFKGVKSIAEFFGVDASEVKSVTKSNQLKLQDEGDLVRICTIFSM